MIIFTETSPNGLEVQRVTQVGADAFIALVKGLPLGLTKGGDYVMGELTPIWVARYGESGGLRITGLEVPEGKAPIMPILSPERF